MFDNPSTLNAAAGQYHAAWTDLAAMSQRQSTELQRSVAAELQAASAGDDGLERSTLSWANYQRDLTRLNIDYYASCKRLQREYLAAIDGLEEHSMNEQFDEAANQLADFIKNGGGCGSQAASSSKPTKK